MRSFQKSSSFLHYRIGYSATDLWETILSQGLRWYFIDTFRITLSPTIYHQVWWLKAWLNIIFTTTFLSDLFEQIVYTFDKYLTTSIAICAYLYPEQNCKRAPISISQIYMVHRAIIHIIMSTLIDWIAITLIAFC